MNQMQYRRQLAEIKWGDNLKKFKCQHTKDGKKCGYHIAIRQPDYSMKCAKCKCVESATAHTAFHGLGIDLDTAMNILFAIQSHWQEYIRSHELANRQGEQARLSVRDLALMFKIEPKMVWRFLNRIIDWLPKSYYKKNNSVDEVWFQGVDKKNRLRYYALYNFLIESSDSEYLEILCNKKPHQN